MTDEQFSRIHLKISQKQLGELDEFIKTFGLTNRTEAIRFLITIGLKYQNGLLKELDS